MKKNIYAVSVAALLCTFASGCSSQKTGQVSEITETAEKVLTPESIVFDWQEAYESKLTSFSPSADSRFDIRDINGDSSPELIISPDTQSSTMCEVYTYSDGAVQKFTDIGSCGTFTYIPASDMIGYEYEGDGFVIGEYYNVSGDLLESAMTYYNNAGSAASGAAITYEVNGETVTLPDYETSLSEYTSQDCLELGRKYTFGTDSINYAIHYSESWGAVLTDAQKELYRSKLSELSETYSGLEDYSLGFELCDLDGNDFPELIFSTGVFPEDICRIFVIQDEELTELNDTFGAFGEISFDITQKIFFSSDSTGSSKYQSLISTDLGGFNASESIMSCGRKYILSAESINSAFL